MKSALQVHPPCDALRTIAWDGALAQRLVGEMRFAHSRAKAGKIIQGLIVTKKD
jgi:hypothetical protein